MFVCWTETEPTNGNAPTEVTVKEPDNPSVAQISQSIDALPTVKANELPAQTPNDTATVVSDALPELSTADPPRPIPIVRDYFQTPKFQSLTAVSESMGTSNVVPSPPISPVSTVNTVSNTPAATQSSESSSAVTLSTVLPVLS